MMPKGRIALDYGNASGGYSANTEWAGCAV